METPFPFSQYVTGKNFVGRKADVTLLGNLLAQGEHVALSSPPKSGKTSLVQQTLFQMRLSGTPFTVGQLSCLNIRSTQDFLLRLGSTLVRMVASTPDEYSAVVKSFLEGTHFVFDPAAFAEREEVVSLGWELDGDDIRAMLSFPFRLAKERNIRLILIADAFHCTALMDNPDELLRPLDESLRRAREAGERGFSYLFLGSGVNAMHQIFAGSRLFSQDVERMSLSPIPDAEMAAHVIKGFLSSGKVMDLKLMEGACRLFDGHPWYINHFAAICDSMTRGFIPEAVLIDALDCLVSVHEPRFARMMASLTTHQVNMLRATLEGVTRFSSAEVIRRYDLHSSANVKRVKDALMKKEILSFEREEAPRILDPLFAYWVKKYYYEITA